MNPAKIHDPFQFLANLSIPRPFVRYQFVGQRRSMYGLTALVLLIVCVIGPMLYSLQQLHNSAGFDRVKPFWIAVVFGALIVVAFVIYISSLNRLWDDSRWLARFGRIEEANLLWVIQGEKRRVVTYRFWTPAGKEIVRETVIDSDGPYPLAPLAAGDVVPVLYDPHSPRSRSMLWAEVERYVTIRDKDLPKLGLTPQSVQ